MDRSLGNFQKRYGEVVVVAAAAAAAAAVVVVKITRDQYCSIFSPRLFMKRRE
jgi:hypothetical protein